MSTDGGSGWPALPGWSAEAIPVASVALGNLLTQGHLAEVVRLGWKDPAGFRTDALTQHERAAATALSPPEARPPEFAWLYLHGGIGMNLVLHDLTLDGNTFKDSRVASELPCPGDAGDRESVAAGSWPVSVHVPREGVRGPTERRQFGVLTLSYFF
jgi:hypothetical protein